MIDATVIEAIGAGGNLATMGLALVLMRISNRVRALELRHEIKAELEKAEPQ